MITRRAMIQMLAAAAFIGGRPTFASTLRLKLIAHRGGVVDPKYAEESPAALEAAIRQGYWMVEVDVRRTKDGRAILNHDPDFQRFYGNPGKVTDMTWAEIRELRATPGGTPPLEFRQLAALCKGRIRLMLDVKQEPHPREFYKNLADALAENDLMETTYILNGIQTEKVFHGRGPLAAKDTKSLRNLLAQGEDLYRYYYMFELAHNISESDVQFAKQQNVNAVAAVNEFRYWRQGGIKQADVDMARVVSLGVDTYQIDSFYKQDLVRLWGERTQKKG